MHFLLHILFSVTLFFIITPPLLASDGHQGTTLGQLTDPSQRGWAATYGGAGEDWATATQQTGDGGYIVAGWTASFSAVNGDLWVLKLEPDGTVEWQKTCGGVDEDKAASIQQTYDRGT